MSRAADSTVVGEPGLAQGGAPTGPCSEGLPVELTTRPQWVPWRYELRNSQGTKVPVSPHTGGRAKSNDPHTWGTFAAALALCEHGRADGVGYMFSADDPYTGIDLDACRDPATGTIEPWAEEIITALSSYTEVSPSGTGVHIIVRAKLPPGGNRKDRVEMYDRARYFTMTGEHLEGTPLTIEPRQEGLDALHRRLLPERYEPQASSPSERTWGRNGATGLTDDEVLGKALGAKNREKFSRLWMGNTDDYGDDHSRADLALCGLLAFWTQDPEQIDRLVRRSGLMRPKWDQRHYADGRTYGQKTVAKAIAVASVGDAMGGDQLCQPTTPSEGNSVTDPTTARQGVKQPAIEHLRKAIETHFPALWTAVDLGLSVCATLLLEKNATPVALVYTGKPSSGKTTVTSMFVGHPVTYLSDKFTPASFVSHAANVSRAQLEKIDLLPKIQHKVLITPEMAPTFRGKEDELTERFNTLIRVLDGQGLSIDSGAQGGEVMKATISSRGSVGPHPSMTRCGV